MNVAAFIEDLNLGLEEQHRGDCPVCSGNNTFTVTRNRDGILYNCYKADCNISGKQSSQIRVSDLTAKAQVPTTPFVLPPHVLVGRPEITRWIETHEYPFENVELYYDIKEERIVFPVRQEGKIVDATGRSIKKAVVSISKTSYNWRNCQPKWKRYGSSSHAYTHGTGDVAVIVEDAISGAMVGATIATATGVALMGTSLLSAHVEQLRAFEGVIIALDPDALKKTLLFSQELRSKLDTNKIFAMKLEDDLKYRKNNDILKLKDKVWEFTEMHGGPAWR